MQTEETKVKQEEDSSKLDAIIKRQVRSFMYEEVGWLLQVLREATVKETIFFKTVVLADKSTEQVPLDQPYAIESTILTSQDVGWIRQRIMDLLQTK